MILAVPAAQAVLRTPSATPMPAGAPLAGAPTPRPASYRFDLSLDADERTLSGRGSVTVTNTSGAPLGDVYMRLWANAPTLARRGASATVGSVSVDGVASNATLDGTVLRVPLATPLAAGASATIDFATSITIPPSMGRTGTGRDGSLYFGNMLPVVAVHDDEGWNLDPYVEAGESFYNQVGSWDVTLRAPAERQIISTGRTVQEQVDNGIRTTHISEPRARDFLIVATTGYEQQSRDVDGTTVRVWSPKGDASTAAQMLDTAAKSLAFYNARYGAYGRDEYDVVAVRGMGGGMEYPGIVLDDMSGSTSFLREVVAHETGHQWFYSNAGNNEFDDPWLDESFTSFITSEYLRTSAKRVAAALEPGFRARTGLTTDAMQEREAATERPRISSPMNVLNNHGYFKIIYQRGAELLEQLKHDLGEDAFVKGMRAHVAGTRDGIATTGGFIATMSSAAGRDLTEWFKQHDVVASEPAANDKLDPNAEL